MGHGDPIQNHGILHKAWEIMEVHWWHKKKKSEYQKYFISPWKWIILLQKCILPKKCVISSTTEEEEEEEEEECIITEDDWIRWILKAILMKNGITWKRFKNVFKTLQYSS